MNVLRELAERVYLHLCLAVGWLLRSGRYSKTWIVRRDGETEVRKVRLSHAPLLIWLGGPLMRMLDTGVRVLPQREWEARERHLHESLRGASVRIDDGGTVVLPRLAGRTLAALLEDPDLGESARMRAIELAVVALAEFHRAGFTHGDAMAENVMIDPELDVARWFDFETAHEANRSNAWCRADDVRALLATCLLRTDRGKLGATLDLVLGVYGDEAVSRGLAANFSTLLRRPLAFHLGQAALPYDTLREIGRVSRARSIGVNAGPAPAAGT